MSTLYPTTLNGDGASLNEKESQKIEKLEVVKGRMFSSHLLVVIVKWSTLVS